MGDRAESCAEDSFIPADGHVLGGLVECVVLLVKVTGHESDFHGSLPAFLFDKGEWCVLPEVEFCGCDLAFWEVLNVELDQAVAEREVAEVGGVDAVACVAPEPEPLVSGCIGGVGIHPGVAVRLEDHFLLDGCELDGSGYGERSDE